MASKAISLAKGGVSIMARSQPVSAATVRAWERRDGGREMTAGD
jgi:hypothetical protein